MMPDEDVTTIRQLIDARAQATPEGILLIDPETKGVVTFRGLQQQSTALYRRLTQEGLKPGDKVAFLMDNGLVSAQVFLGTMYAGFATVPLNVRAGVVQLSYMLHHCNAKVVFVEAQYAALLREAMGSGPQEIRVIPVDDAAWDCAAGSPVTIAPPPGPDDVAMLMYSSGSTGTPKAAIHTHASVLAHARNSVCSHQLTSADRSLLVLPLYHINAECVTLLPTLLSGGSIVVPHRFSVSQFWEWMHDWNCTWSALVPTIISELVDWEQPDSRQQAAFARIRFLRSSSAPLSPALQRRFLDKFKLPLLQAMGSTEAGNVFSNPVPPGENKIGSPGLAWGFEARIVDRDGVDQPNGEAGEVLLRGAALMQGYYRDPEATAAVLDSDGWLHTGDLAYRDEYGYFFMVGRSRELVIKGGVNISPRQIDEILESHPAVLEAAAVGVPDHYLGEDLLAFVVLRAASDCDESELLAFCESRLGYFKTPTRIHFVEALPKGPSGKVQRLRLLDQTTVPASGVKAAWFGGKPMASVGAGGVEGSTGAVSSIEQVIATAWADVLSLPQVELGANFFALGGHSLLAIQCLSQLRDKLPIVLSLSDFFEHSTVSEQAALIRRRLSLITSLDSPNSGAGSTDPDRDQIRRPVAVVPKVTRREDVTSPSPLSCVHESIRYLEQLNPEVPFYNEADAVRLRGALDVAAIQDALRSIVARHEALRSTVQIVDGQPRAIVHESMTVKLKQIDLSSLPPVQRESEAERLMIEEMRVPFNFQSESGLRVALLRLGPQDHILLVMMHHTISDWASIGIFYRELSAFYGAFLRGEQARLPEVPIHFADYAAWQQRQIANDVFVEDMEFWEENLRGAPKCLALPSDRPRPSAMTHRGSRLRWILGKDLTSAIRELSRREKRSLFTIFAAALNVLLYRYTGVEDISVGIPLADRDQPELQTVIGCLLQTHVLRTRLSGDLTFSDLLGRVQRGALDLYTHRSIPFEHVVRNLRPERDPSYSPLFQVMLNWRDRDQTLAVIGLDGVDVEWLMAENQTSKFDLLLFATDIGDEIYLEMEYSTALFDADRIERMLGHFETLLEAAARDASAPVAELPLLTRQERQQVLLEWNRTECSYPRDTCLDELIDEQVSRTPDACAAIFGDTRWTYRALSDRADRVARHLRDLGVGPNIVVGLHVERSLEMLVGLLGILKAGGAYLPLDPSYPQERLSFILKDARPAILLTQQGLRANLPPHDSAVVSMEMILSAAETERGGCIPTTGRQSSDLAYVLYTSGSTGAPKGVQVPHRALVNLLTSMRREPGITSADTLLAVTTLSFDISALELFLPLTTGACVVIASADAVVDGKQLMALIERWRVTLMQATPATWRLLLEAGWHGSSTLNILCGGEAWSTDLADELLPRCKSLWNMYGPTETTIWSSVSRVRAGRPVLIGPPIANTTFYVLDQSRQPVPVGVPGELHIGGDGLALGYLGQPELTQQRFTADPFSALPGARMYKTGDAVCRLRSGEIQFLGRLDDQVKLRGFRIELGEIEACLRQHPAISECAVVAQGKTAAGKRLVAYFVPADPGDGAPDSSELQETLKRKLPQYMVPSAFVAIDALPLTPNGKVDRAALSVRGDSPDERVSAAPQAVTPRNSLELHLIRAWEQILGFQGFGVEDNFFDLGGHSLLAIRVINEINNTFGVNFPLPAFARDPTIRGIAESLRQESRSRGEPKLLLLARGSGTGDIFFLGAGLAECRIAELLNTKHAVYATWVPLSPAIAHAAKAKKGSRVPSLQELAAPHVSLILDQQPSGRCVLVGYSFMGLLAFEVAHQLQRAGRNVDLLLLVDCWATIPTPWQKLKVKGLLHAAGALRTRTRQMVRSSLRHRTSTNSLIAPEKTLGHMPWEILREIGPAVIRDYQFRPVDSRAIIFSAIEDQRRTYLSVDSAMGWGGLFGRGLEIVDLPGDHHQIFDMTNSAAVLRRLKDALANADLGYDEPARLAEDVDADGLEARHGETVVA